MKLQGGRYTDEAVAVVEVLTQVTAESTLTILTAGVTNEPSTLVAVPIPSLS